MKFVDLELFQQLSKTTAMGLMRNLIGIWYSNARLAACSATSGINQIIRTTVFTKVSMFVLLEVLYITFTFDLEYCEMK